MAVVWCGYGLDVERLEQFRFSVGTVPLGRGFFVQVCQSLFWGEPVLRTPQANTFHNKVFHIKIIEFLARGGFGLKNPAENRAQKREWFVSVAPLQNEVAPKSSWFEAEKQFE